MSEALLPIETDEKFLVTIVSPDIVTADREAWETLERFLGVDPVEAWKLVEMTHAPERDEQGRMTGNLVSSAEWKRDQSVETPPNLVIPAGIEEPVEDTDA